MSSSDGSHIALYNLNKLITPLGALFFFSTVVILYCTIMAFRDTSRVFFFSPLLKVKGKFADLELSSDEVLK